VRGHAAAKLSGAEISSQFIVNILQQTTRLVYKGAAIAEDIETEETAEAEGITRLELRLPGPPR